MCIFVQKTSFFHSGSRSIASLGEKAKLLEFPVALFRVLIQADRSSSHLRMSIS
jgi:hypothetical protein